MKKVLEIERKFLIKGSLPLEISEAHSAKITQWYLPKDSDGRSPRIRHKYELITYPINTYYFTRKKQIKPGVNEEEEKEISFKTFNQYLKKIDLKKRPIEKTRYYLPWKNNIFELDIFHGFNQGLIMLEIELKQPDEKFEFPPYLTVGREVTHDKSYSNKSLATKSKTK